MDFTAIDFETASDYRTSACSIGIAVVEGNKVVDTQHHLIKPYPDFFHPFNVQIHGITKDDVANAPTFDELWPEIQPYLDHRIVAAHFAPFDMSVLIHTLEFYGIDKPELDILCSCRLAKAAYPSLQSHRLNNVCDYLGIALEHHRADSDAEGSARIICNIMEESGIEGLADFKETFSLIPGFLRNGAYKPFRTASMKTGGNLETFDAECPCEEFLDKDFVFSGTLQSMPRKKAFEVVSKGGGYPQKGIAQGTDYLVCGVQDLARLHGANMSSKMRRALEMQAGGHPIRIIGEDEFVRMIDDRLYGLCFGDAKPPETGGIE